MYSMFYAINSFVGLKNGTANLNSDSQRNKRDAYFALLANEY